MHLYHVEGSVYAFEQILGIKWEMLRNTWRQLTSNELQVWETLIYMNAFKFGIKPEIRESKWEGRCIGSAHC